MNSRVVRIEHTIRATSREHAQDIFAVAGTRLLHVRGWTRLAESLLFSSEHRDDHGVPVTRPAQVDDYINLTSDEQRPFGWMQVSQVERNDNFSGNATVVLVATPVGLPFDAHSSDSSSPAAEPLVISVERHGLEVTSSVIIHKNPITSIFEQSGVYVVQWRSLVMGLLIDTDHPAHENIPRPAVESHNG